MKKYFKIFLAILFIAILIGTFYFLWSKTKVEVEPFDIISSDTTTIENLVVATGKIEPRDEVLIKPQISGIISKLHKEAGDKVKTGDIIATIKVIPEMVQLNSAESRVKTAVIDLDQRESEYIRTKGLHEKGVTSTEEYDQVTTTYKRSLEELQNAKDNLDIIKTGITTANANMSNTQIRSTIDGMILNIPVKEGNSVILSNTFNDGTTIAIIADMSDMMFHGKVDETDVGKIEDGMPVRIKIGAMQDVELDAELEYISPKSVDVEGVTMFEVKIAVTLPKDIFLRAGYSANASVVTLSKKDIMTIPESAIDFREEKRFVHILTSAEDSEVQTFEEREIKTGISDGANIEVLEGITPKDKLRN